MPVKIDYCVSSQYSQGWSKVDWCSSPEEVAAAVQKRLSKSKSITSIQVVAFKKRVRKLANGASPPKGLQSSSLSCPTT